MKKLIPTLILILSCVAAAVYQPHTRKAFRQFPSGVGPDWTATNALIWYKANSITGNNGDPVNTWTDSSGNGRTAYKYLSPIGYAVAPVLSNNVINGFPAIHFYSTVTNALTNSFALTQPCTFFVVVRYTADTASSQVIFDSISSPTRMQCAFNQALAWKMSLSGSTTQSSPDAAPTDWTLYTIYLNQASSSIRTNGVAWFTVGATPGDLVGNGQTLGLRYANDTFPLKGDIAEYVVYNGTMANGDRNWVEYSLTNKYGIYKP